MDLKVRNVVSKRRFALAELSLILIGLTIWLTFPAKTHAQNKYYPDHPDVRAMCDAALPNIVNATRDNKRGTLCALAVVQYYKRYESRVPRDNEFVKSMVEIIAPQFVAPNDIVDEQELYYPCLAMILLAEYDAKKYAPEIKRFLQKLKERQRPNGAFTYKTQPNSGDTSQTQFAALAMSVAKTHGFNVDVEMGKKALNWLCSSHQNGQWIYKLVYAGGGNGPGRPDPTANNQPGQSMQAAGLGSVYLLSDFLQLYQRSKSMSGSLSNKDIGLPRTVTIYVKPVDGEESMLNKQGPLVTFERGKLNNATKAGNVNLINNFSPYNYSWNYYFLYALERYAYFREQAEGDMRGLENWYDQTIDFMKGEQQADGSFPRGQDKKEVSIDATAFAVLFMVRSSEVINLPISTSVLDGGIGFENDQVIRQDDSGKIRGLEAEKSLSDMLDMLKDGKASQKQMQKLTESLKKQIVKFRKKDDKSRGEIKAFLRSMIGAKNYFRRLIAVRFLAGEQDMDNAPALIYALGDPDYRIAVEAHNGLRLISRKIDSLVLSSFAKENAPRDSAVLTEEEKSNLRQEFARVKKEWTDWYLKIRPGAELLD